MKNVLTFILLFLSQQIAAQKNNIHPVKVYCDSQYVTYSAFENSDGSMLVVGGAFDTQADGLIMKFDANNNVVWRKTYGGTQNDYFYRIKQINSNRFLLVGIAVSTDGDLAAYSPPFPTAGNIWMMIIDSNGNFVRGNTYGYGSSTGVNGVELRSDGKIFISGSTVAEGGDFVGNPGDPLIFQAFIALTDTMLSKKWLFYLAGLPSDDIVLTASCLDKYENLIVCIGTPSTSGVYAGMGPYAGQFDNFIFCIDTNQNVLWKRRYGGNRDEIVRTLQTDANNNLYMLVYSNSDNGDYFTNEIKYINPSGGLNYACLLKFDSNGNIVWKHAFGSFDTTMTESRSIDPLSMIRVNDKFWVYSRISGRDSVGEGYGWTPQFAAQDTWVTQFDSNGILENKMRIGGTRLDIPRWIYYNSVSNKMLIGLNSAGSDPADIHFDCITKKGVTDCKIFELQQWPTQVINHTKLAELVCNISPNPSEGVFNIKFEKPITALVQVFNVEGKKVVSTTLKTINNYQLNMADMPNGIYTAKISSEEGIFSKQLFVNH